jgi:hypothetical protein
MPTLQIESIEEPFRSHPELAASAVRLLNTSAYAGLLAALPTRSLGVDLIVALASSLGSTTIAMIEVKSASALTGREVAANQLDRYKEALDRLQSEIEGSPRPDGEWAPVLETLGEELVASLVGASASSVRRYSNGERSTPQDVAERLHFLALLLGHLAGSYNDYGMRRWFSRPRTALDGRAPADLMGKDFDPDGPDGERMRQLAEGARAA